MCKLIDGWPTHVLPLLSIRQASIIRCVFSFLCPVQKTAHSSNIGVHLRSQHCEERLKGEPPVSDLVCSNNFWLMHSRSGRSWKGPCKPHLYDNQSIGVFYETNIGPHPVFYSLTLSLHCGTNLTQLIGSRKNNVNAVSTSYFFLACEISNECTVYIRYVSSYRFLQPCSDFT